MPGALDAPQLAPHAHGHMCSHTWLIQPQTFVARLVEDCIWCTGSATLRHHNCTLFKPWPPCSQAVFLGKKAKSGDQGAKDRLMLRGVFDSDTQAWLSEMCWQQDLYW